MAAKYGPIVRFRMPGRDRDTVLITDADMIAETLRSDGPMPRRDGIPTWNHFRQKNNVPLGVALENGDEWKRIRSAIQTPIFPPKSAHAYCPAIDPATVQVMDVLENGMRRAGPRALAGEDPIAMEDMTMRWSIDAITAIVLGQRLGALDADPNPLAREMIRAAIAMNATTGPVFMLPEFVWRNRLTAIAREHFDAMQTIMDLTTRLMNTTLTELAQDPAKLEGSFLAQVLKRDATITRAEMLSTTVDLMFAGIDTTSRTLLHLMNMLGRHPDVQTKLRSEIFAVVGADPNTQLDATHLAKFKYMKNVIKEAMRTFMVIPIGARNLVHDAVIGGYTIPEGTHMMLGIQAMADNPKYFAYPDQFNPDRWNSKDIHPFASLPFGFGPRMCVGRRIAEMEMAVYVAHLLRRFEVMPAPAPKDIIYSIFMYSKDPVPLKFRLLNKTTVALASSSSSSMEA
ncbi:hypothetical protein GGF32_006006 [Allomyces javanicus]|nr:hypothetical protein GGF32_006006 [Allomyces javanicus]